jgi:catechol 2,3-dioxygenase-like lactoylglutathione lyase family enzyme
VLTVIKGRADDRDESAAAAGKPARVKYPSSFHIGFIVESRERVNQIHQQLRDDGIEADAPAHLHGAWTFYFMAPGGFTIEVMG